MTDEKLNGTVFYDGECRLCTALAERHGELLQRRGFDLAPLQNAGVRERLGIDPAQPLIEMRVLTRDGRTLGGADGLLHLAGFIWWAKPLRFMARLPGGKSILRKCYRWVAAHRHCVAGTCSIGKRSNWPRWMPLLALPVLAVIFTSQLPAWFFMWVLAVAIFAGCKWLTWWESSAALGAVSYARSFAYLFLWPGMDAQSFLDGEKSSRDPTVRDWFFAVSKTLLGAVLLWILARYAWPAHPLMTGWIGMLGLIFLLHFGAFHLIALFWQTVGIAAEPIMRSPFDARSLSEFWSYRWNRGFNALAHRHVFQSVQRRVGITGATIFTFLASGLIHDFVISVPARAGYGLPTLYFMLQGLGVLAERSRLGKRAGLRRGIRGRIFALTVAAGPVCLVFHPPFVARVIIPFLAVIKAI